MVSCWSSIRPPVCSFLADDEIINKGFSPNLVCALILWRFGLDYLLVKLSAGHMIVAGYYHFTFLFIDQSKYPPSGHTTL